MIFEGLEAGHCDVQRRMETFCTLLTASFGTTGTRRSGERFGNPLTGEISVLIERCPVRRGEDQLCDPMRHTGTLVTLSRPGTCVFRDNVVGTPAGFLVGVRDFRTALIENCWF